MFGSGCAVIVVVRRSVKTAKERKIGEDIVVWRGVRSRDSVLPYPGFLLEPSDAFQIQLLPLFPLDIRGEPPLTVLPVSKRLHAHASEFADFDDDDAPALALACLVLLFWEGDSDLWDRARGRRRVVHQRFFLGVSGEDGGGVTAVGRGGDGEAPVEGFVRMARGRGVCGKGVISRARRLRALSICERAPAGAEHVECDNCDDADDDEDKECDQEVDHRGRQVCGWSLVAVASLEGGHPGGGCFTRGMQRATTVVGVRLVGVVDRHVGQFRSWRIEFGVLGLQGSVGPAAV